MMLVGCCLGPKEDACIDFILVSLLWWYSEWKFLSRCCILKFVLLVYVIVVSRKLKELLSMGSFLSSISRWYVFFRRYSLRYKAIVYEMGSFFLKGKNAVRSSMYLIPAHSGPLGLLSLFKFLCCILWRILAIFLLKICS